MDLLTVCLLQFFYMFDAPTPYFHILGMRAAKNIAGTPPVHDHSLAVYRAMMADPLLKSDHGVRKRAVTKVWK